MTKRLFLEYFHLPSCQTSRFKPCCENNMKVRPFINIPTRKYVWKRVNPTIAEFPLLTHIRQGLRSDIFSRLVGTQVPTIKDLLESCNGIEEIIDCKAKEAAKASIPAKSKRERRSTENEKKRQPSLQKNHRRP